MKTLREQAEDLIKLQTEVAREAAARFDLAAYNGANSRITETLELLKLLAR